MNKRFDHLIIGVLIGLVTPLLTLYLFYVFTYRSQTSFSGFIAYFTKFRQLVPAMSLCVIANLLVFFLFIWTSRYQSARGIVIATFGYGAWVAYHKFFA